MVYRLIIILYIRSGLFPNGLTVWCVCRPEGKVERERKKKRENLVCLAAFDMPPLYDSIIQIKNAVKICLQVKKLKVFTWALYNRTLWFISCFLFLGMLSITIWLGVLRGLGPTSRDFGGAIGPPSHHHPGPAGRGNRGNNRSDVSIQVSCRDYWPIVEYQKIANDDQTIE